MGFIRGALGIFISILLLIVFFVGGIFLTLTLSLQYDNVHDKISPVIQNTLEEELGVNLASEIEDELILMEIYCENSLEDYVFSEQGYAITLSCESLTQGAEGIINSGIDSLIESAYYKEYTCNFWKCFGEEEIPLFLVSEYAKDYWKAKSYLAMGVALVLILTLFFIYRKKPNTFIIPGILLIVVAIPFLKIGALISFSGDRIVLELLSIFFSRSISVFRIFLFSGIGLVVIGLFFKLFLVGFRFSKFFHREESKGIKVVKEVKAVKNIKSVKENKSSQKPKKK